MQTLKERISAAASWGTRLVIEELQDSHHWIIIEKQEENDDLRPHGPQSFVAKAVWDDV